jgi:hypothetical protein
VGLILRLEIASAPVGTFVKMAVQGKLSYLIQIKYLATLACIRRTCLGKSQVGIIIRAALLLF